MSVHDPYSAGDPADELPPLPIPRPGEWSPMRPTNVEPVLPPRSLGGGASFTAASTDSPAAPDPTAHAATPSERADAIDRLPWELAAQLTAGMLANPGRSHASVKDAMGLFDQLLHELHAYARMAIENDLHARDESRQRSHGEYFQRHGEQAAEEPAQPTEPRRPALTPPPHVAKPAPTQPAPGGSYRPIPPGARGPYSPGSMAGAPPDQQDVDPGSQHVA